MVNEGFIKTSELPCTELNEKGSSLYAKVLNVKTHVVNNNPDIPSVTLSSQVVRLYYRAFTYTSNSFDEVRVSLRFKTGLQDNENVCLVDRIPSNFELKMCKESDGSVSIYAKCNQNEKVRFQLIEGSDSFVTKFSNAKLDKDISGLTSMPIVQMPIKSTDILPIGDNIIVNTPIGGALKPERNGSVSLGTNEAQWKEGYFTQVLKIPFKITGSPTNDKNSLIFVHAATKTLYWGYNEKWYGVQLTEMIPPIN